MESLIRILLVAGALLASPASAQTRDFSNLVGTWSSKSHSVHTGPGFYNPVDDQFIEPPHTGISYSFTADGHYEEAYYRAVANPTHPECPSGVMQWQHGTFELLRNGSLSLTPIGVDGRQLESIPCRYDRGLYIRYEQPEFFERYEVVLDGFHNVRRLNLYQFDGSPLMPLYLAYSPPQMLPTITLNPTTAPTSSSPQATATRSSNRKRSFPDKKLEKLFSPSKSRLLDPDHWWWFGIVCTSVGTLAYVFS